jgi:fermentation-respiration switch protein FrsA (DUF1100 family)
MKRLLIAAAATIIIFTVATIGASFYMLDYSLAPDEERADTAKCFKKLVEAHPEVKPWLDSLKARHALKDTFVTMPTGERHHGYYIRHHDNNHKAAVVLHGWRVNAIEFLYIARLYHQLAGYNVLLPDLHAHGLSEGEAIGMGWNERKDVLHWMEIAARLFDADQFVVHGVSMGAATTMNVSGEKMPKGIGEVRFVEDCGYTSVWDEFSYRLKEEFGLPEFPLMYSTSLLCKLKYGWSFGEASSSEQVRHCPYPMLFIHGDSDDFVPSTMVHPLYDAKSQPKKIWITKGAKHAMSYTDYPKAYAQHIMSLLP